MDPLMLSMVVAYFLLRRGGENAMWAFRKDGADPPSFRRWQERQKRRGTRASITGRTEGRKFWAHVWHDAHASAHEWRQRRYGRRWEDRRKRWQAEDVQRQQNQPLAPCVFCRAGRGEDCAPDCPEVLGHRANRDSVDRATVPPQREVTEPATGTTPSQPSQTEPTAPSHPDGTVRPATEPTEPGPVRVGVGVIDRAAPDPATEPSHQADDESPTAGIVHDSDEYVLARDNGGAPASGSFPGPSFNSREEVIAWADKARCGHCGAKANLRGFDDSGRYQCDVAHDAGCPSTDQPLIVADDLARKRAEKAIANPGMNDGGTVTTPATYNTGAVGPSGEFAGYEATVAGWDQIGRLGAELDAAYERQMAALRALKADERTIGQVARAREANENHMVAAGEARNDWVTRHGAVKEVKDATGARGDEALHR